ncbi:MAG: glutamine-hydrolyzing carbamoyl-phosphate synthase small subunit [Rhodospirillales bacterium]|jgi:carbamoyl-phosphate synthase small subunit|nr:glutamine-hydrolyzing carbamoyl-phosphate synthase small subunit [Rhodospirillales bacterium]
MSIESNVSVTAPQGSRPSEADAVLVLADGTVFWGAGAGAAGSSVGEVCFNTSLTGYQEILTDPSYAGQIINFTFPHIGNVGTTPEDIETVTPAARGCVLRMDITNPANWRAAEHLDSWLKSRNLTAVSGIDTRRLTRIIRDNGAPSGVVAYAPGDGASLDVAALAKQAADWPGLEGMDLAKDVSCTQPYAWDQTQWSLESGHGTQTNPQYHVVAVDYGAKLNILRCLASCGCKVTVVPATSTAEDIMKYGPDGVFLSNGPGDPAATGEYAVPMIKEIIEAGIPLFGICLGHQMLALALGAKTYKMHMGHRGANQPVKDLKTDKVEITSQNHGFCVDKDSLPAGVTMTHQSLFDETLEGLEIDGKPVFSVQHHPEASPGPHDSHYLFDRFVRLMEKKV